MKQKYTLYLDPERKDLFEEYLINNNFNYVVTNKRSRILNYYIFTVEATGEEAKNIYKNI